MNGEELLRRWQMKEYPDAPVLPSHAFEALARDIDDLVKLSRESVEKELEETRAELIRVQDELSIHCIAIRDPNPEVLVERLRKEWAEKAQKREGKG